MTIEAIGDLARVVAVVASVLYLAFQVRATARESRAAAVRAMQDSINQWISGGVDREVATLWLKGLSDYRTLEMVERSQFNSIIQVLFRIAEDALTQHRQRRLPEATWIAFESTIAGIVAAPGAQAWWSNRADVFTPEFRAWVGDQIDRSAGSLELSPTENP